MTVPTLAHHGTLLKSDGNGTFVPVTQTQAAGPATLVVTDVTAATNGAGHWQTGTAGAMFFGVPDSIFWVGYNRGTGGVPSIASEPAWYTQWEADYYQNGTARTMEYHLDFAPRTDGATTIAVASNGQTLPQATINVASTTNFPNFGTLTIGLDTVTYTGKTGTTFTGCTGGTHVLSTGEAVTAGFNVNRPIMIQVNRDTGLVTQFSLSAPTISFLDWVTQNQMGAVSYGTVNWWSAGTTGSTLALGNTPTGTAAINASSHANIVFYDGGFTTGAAFQLGTVNGNKMQLSGQGVSLVNFYQQRGIAINVDDNAAALTVQSGTNTSVTLQVRAKAASQGDLLRIQDSTPTTQIKVTSAFSLVVGSAALATTATDGFLYIPTCAGTPTGVPTTQAGTAAVVYDTTNNKLAVYNGGWKQVALV